MERKKTKACEDGLYKVVSDNGINMFDGWGTMCEFIKTDKPTNEDVINAIEKSIRDSIEKEVMKSLSKPTVISEPIWADGLKKIQQNRPSIHIIEEKDQVRLYTSHANTDARFEAFRSLMPSSLIESEVMLKKGTNMRITISCEKPTPLGVGWIALYLKNNSK